MSYQMKKIQAMSFGDFCVNQGLTREQIDLFTTAQLLCEAGVGTRKQHQQAQLLKTLMDEYRVLCERGTITAESVPAYTLSVA